AITANRSYRAELVNWLRGAFRLPTSGGETEVIAFLNERIRDPKPPTQEYSGRAAVTQLESPDPAGSQGRGAGLDRFRSAESAEHDQRGRDPKACAGERGLMARCRAGPWPSGRLACHAADPLSRTWWCGSSPNRTWRADSGGRR